MKTRDFLAQVARLVRTEQAFIRKDRKAGIDGTGERAYWVQEEGKEESLPSDSDYSVADAALAFARSVDIATATKFARDVQAVCAKVDLDFNKAYMAAAILEMAISAGEDEALRVAAEKSAFIEKPVGFELRIGKGVKILQMRTLTVRGFDRNIVKMLTPEGNLLTWWASKMPEGVKVGDSVRFIGRIKGPNEYQGVKSTLVTRCTLINLAD